LALRERLAAAPAGPREAIWIDGDSQPSIDLPAGGLLAGARPVLHDLDSG
jgi:hypothetical protein